MKTSALIGTLALSSAGAIAWAAGAPDTSGEYGPHPVLPAPEKSLFPTLNFATARPWSGDAAPVAAAGLRVTALARGLQHPRWLYVLPNGDILVAETEAPAKPGDGTGIRGAIQKHVMRRAGSGANPSANRITLLRDVAGDGMHVERHVFLQGLNAPIGMVLVGHTFYVADTDAVVSVPYQAGQTEIRVAPTVVTALPAGDINHHWTKTLVADAGGDKLYVGVGSNSNAGERGLAAESERDAVWQIDTRTHAHVVYASGWHGSRKRRRSGWR